MSRRAGILIALTFFLVSAVVSQEWVGPAHRAVGQASTALVVVSQQAMLRARRIERALEREGDAQQRSLVSLRDGTTQVAVRDALEVLRLCLLGPCEERKQLAKKVKSRLGDQIGLSRDRLENQKRRSRIRDYELFGLLAAGGLVMLGFALLLGGSASEKIETGNGGDEDEPRGEPGGEAGEDLGALEETLRARLEQLYQVRKKSRDNARFAAFGEVAAGLSHGLKTPLACVRAAAQVAQAKIADEHGAQNNLEDIIDEVDGLVRQINSFLRTMGGGEPVLEELELPRLLSSLDERYRTGIANRGITWTLQGTEKPARVLGEAELIEMALRNLIDNAFEASAEGGEVLLAVRNCRAPSRVGIDAEAPRPDLLDLDWLEIAVLDQGAGITAKVAAAERPESTRVDGSGLGIAIARRIAARLGGALELTPRGDAAGTRASFFLPPVLETNSEITSEGEGLRDDLSS